MVAGTLSLIQKSQTSGRSRQWMQWNSGIWWWGHVFGAKRSNQWIQSHNGHSTQWTQYAVDAVCSGIVLYGGGDIVFDTKSSNQWTQWTQYAVDAVE